jgi:hypothetical protein
MVAVNATTGELIWKTYDMPDNDGQAGGYSGGQSGSLRPSIRGEDCSI